jgi:D-proline reductase (dithiol) PrdB
MPAPSDPGDPEETSDRPAELPWKVRLFLKGYRWHRLDPVPWSPLQKPLRHARVALVSTAGFTTADQPPFDPTTAGGDPSFRCIPDHYPVQDLQSSHRSHAFDPSGLAADRNLGLPLDRLHELVASGRIGSAAPSHLSFMGSITRPRRLIEETAPHAANRLVEHGVDLALFVPV